MLGIQKPGKKFAFPMDAKHKLDSFPSPRTGIVLDKHIGCFLDAISMDSVKQKFMEHLLCAGHCVECYTEYCVSQQHDQDLQFGRAYGFTWTSIEFLNLIK